MRHLKSRRVPYLVCFSVVFPLVALWSLATPVMAVVDGPPQAFAAAAAVRGEFHPPFVQTPIGKQQSVRVPGRLAALQDVSGCLVNNADTPAQCTKAPAASNHLTSVPTQFMRYPPLFGWAIGWTTFVFSGLAAYWAMVLVAATMNSALLALGLWALLGFARRRLMVLAWMLCLTPYVVYLAGSVNDSGFEISASIAAWSCLLALAGRERPPGRLVAAAGASTAVFMLARPASPLWVVIMVVTAALVAGPRRLAAYARQLAVQVAAGAVVVSGLLAVAWRQVVGSPVLEHVAAPPAHPTLHQALNGAFIVEPSNLWGLVGFFLNAHVPLATLMLWIAAFGVLAVGGLAFARPTLAVAAAVLAAFAIAGPVAANVIEYPQIGLWWQPRYGIPFIVGLPLLLAAAVPEGIAARRESRRLVALAITAIVIAGPVCYVWLLHRYAAGIDGSWRPADFGWQPPGGVVPLSVLFIAASVLLGFCVWRWTRSQPPSEPRAEGADPPADTFEWARPGAEQVR